MVSVDCPVQFVVNFAACLSDRLGVSGRYAHKYYFDYPQTAPLARFLLIDPAVHRDDAQVEYCKNDETVECDWLAARIDAAKAAGMWMIVGMHKNCITVGIKGCSVSPELLNMLVEKKVDLILPGHDHNYQRSKRVFDNLMLTY